MVAAGAAGLLLLLLVLLLLLLVLVALVWVLVLPVTTFGRQKWLVASFCIRGFELNSVLVLALSVSHPLTPTAWMDW